MSSSIITVFIVDSCAIAQQRLTGALSAAPVIQVIGTANNGTEALEHIPQLQPDVVCTNLQMPHMDGFELIRQLLALCPLPILVVSPTVQPTETETIAQVLKAGAVDVFPQPLTGRWKAADQQALIDRIKVLAGVKVFTKSLRQHSTTHILRSSVTHRPSPRLCADAPQILAIGASTGGPQAIHQILSRLPADFPLPILCAQHISAGFLPGLISWQASMCPLHVKVAEAGEVPVPGTVYFAPDHYHLTLDDQGRCHYSAAPAVDRHCPSITVMFQAVAQHYGAGVLGVLLTGMGQDGAVGLQKIAQSGGSTIAQDETTSIVFGMPKVAIELGAAQTVLPVEQIASSILQQLSLPHSV
ncbi:Chemotaxis response regulator protein-glutamate methylesterase [Acaryochloris thomasi RCC1774]|uniref:Protein-glutamate methylesterase/protein-glutamine glutaminase n=1 Tax=Acaryochloris thomasi RCC1774 TaxID=1764569 RepID=A0A2W1JHA7_9CYAN|nr:chemotaxis-specific protein-glutamate methyltransferase CheB [Acaryochloris thomasi]PZD70532.1 Chemotaxis response regulator protein-glutamate methylesterase [Acaryochloris thomasi RCC1774]